MEEIYYVYHIFRPEDEGQYDKGYIGITHNYKTRESRHFLDLKKGIHCNLILQRAYHKYGNLKFKVIAIASKEHAQYIEFQARPRPQMGWNICTGGSQPNLGKKMSQETVAKMKQLYKDNPALVAKCTEGLMDAQWEWRRNNPDLVKQAAQRRLETLSKKGWKIPRRIRYIADGVAYDRYEDILEKYNITIGVMKLRCYGQYVESVKVDGKYKSVRRKYSENPHKVNPYPNWGMEKVKGTA